MADRLCVIDGNELVLVFPYDAPLITDIKALPLKNRRYDPQDSSPSSSTPMAYYHKCSAHVGISISMSISTTTIAVDGGVIAPIGHDNVSHVHVLVHLPTALSSE